MLSCFRDWLDEHGGHPIDQAFASDGVSFKGLRCLQCRAERLVSKADYEKNHDDLKDLEDYLVKRAGSESSEGSPSLWDFLELMD